VLRKSGAADADVAACLKTVCEQINAVSYPYYFMGPNSNSAVNTLMLACGEPVNLPLTALGGDRVISYAPQ